MNDKCHKRTAIIGAGMAGLLAAINLKKAKREFMVFEKADSLGGTWRDNRYPGLTCDVPAHAYTYSFAPYAEWNAYHATGPEIKRYFEKVAGDYGITPFIHFNTDLKSGKGIYTLMILNIYTFHFNSTNKIYHRKI